MFAAVIIVLPLLAKANDVVHLPDYSLKYSVKIQASKDIVWNIWSDVDNWKKFDERLQYSYLEGDKAFKQGVIGYLKAKNAPKTKFEIIQFEEGVSFTESLKIPLYQTIDLQRYFEHNEEDNALIVTHEVNFKGSLRAVMYALLCRPFKKDLKLVLGRIKELAEQKEVKSLN